MNRKVLCSVISFCVFFLLYADTITIVQSSIEGPLVIIERSDFSKYENGKYIGHVYREARLDVVIKKIPDGLQYSGDVLILEEAYRDMIPIAKRMDTVFPINYIEKKDGTFAITKDAGYPLLRGIPLIPQQPLVQGNTWEGTGTVVIRGNTQEQHVRVPVLVAYEFAGITKYNNEQVYYIKAQYAVRYKGTDKYGEPSLIRTEGGRIADIYVSMNTGFPIFIREIIDETYYYQSGKTVRFKGFLLHFIRGAFSSEPVLLALGRTGLLQDTQNQQNSETNVTQTGQNQDTESSNTTAQNPSSDTGSQNQNTSIVKNNLYEIVDSPKGQVILLFDLRFLPDSDELLPSEKPRLDEIAKILLSIPDRMFLVEGHTADVGNPKGQYALSEARAKKIVDELVKRGVPAGRFIYKGWGADKPIAPNDTEQNRARNRRVEITILH
ncbi:MAG TPA: OmpA family protein [Spirochaetia bacterium]|nr:OmpA family protein [Spirochaetales bacterium]HPD80135.1 OmpA family protein [Spirochaetales bacterium]HQK33937.1 OmpA family protein [Spirochaetales bacterium]HRS65143.1 OmpA family protein [Spirochaetia bacterium]